MSSLNRQDKRQIKGFSEKFEITKVIGNDHKVEIHFNAIAPR